MPRVGPYRFRIGVDVGGTFTDLVVSDRQQRHVQLHKSETTPQDPVAGVLNALGEAARELDRDVSEFLGDTGSFVHGTTIATNTLLTRSGATVALVCTEGFRDDLAIRRGRREYIWDVLSPFEEPLVPRHRRLGVRERVDKTGTVRVPLERTELTRIEEAIRISGATAVAICLFNAYLSPVHEEKLAEHVAAALPGVHVSVSSKVLPTVGEYERTATTVADAFVAPGVAGYLGRLCEALEDLGLCVPLLVTTNNGGLVRAEHCRRRPVSTVLSGPAAGAAAARLYGSGLTAKDLVLLDVGGTSTDVTLLSDGSAHETDRISLGGYDVAVRAVDVHTIGTGGGSIGAVDAGGLIRVGPEGAGADPGPACYGRGGELPTVTDAQVVLGRLQPGSFLGGKLRIRPERARQAIERHVATRLSLDALDAAYAIVRVSLQNMADATRLAAVECALALREAVLIAGGGAGGLHGAELADVLGIRRVLVPRLGGGLCAVGMLHADVVHEYSEAHYRRLDSAAARALSRAFTRWAQVGYRELEQEGFPKDRVTVAAIADLRYVGQQWAIATALGNPVTDAAAITKTFHRRHGELYGHANVASEIECLRLRVRATGKSGGLDLQPVGARPAAPAVGSAEVFVDRKRRTERVPVHAGASLGPGAVERGPALIQLASNTIWLPPGWKLEVTASGDFALTGSGEGN